MVQKEANDERIYPQSFMNLRFDRRHENGLPYLVVLGLVAHKFRPFSEQITQIAQIT